MNNYTRRMVLPIDEVVWHIRAQPADKFNRIRLHGFEVGVSSIRLRTFARDFDNIRCAHCGIQGQFFSIDSHRDQLAYTHLNLNAITDTGKETLMTCDHILARGLGGRDHLDNTQTLCTRCNAAKSGEESRIANEIRYVLRTFPDDETLMPSVKDAVSEESIYLGAVKHILTRWMEKMNLPELYTR